MQLSGFILFIINQGTQERELSPLVFALIPHSAFSNTVNSTKEENQVCLFFMDSRDSKLKDCTFPRPNPFFFAAMYQTPTTIIQVPLKKVKTGIKEYSKGNRRLTGASSHSILQMKLSYLT